MKLRLAIAVVLALCSCSGFSKLKKDEAIQYIHYSATSLYTYKVIGCTTDRIYLECTTHNLISGKPKVFVYWTSKTEFNKKELKLLKEIIDQKRLYDSTSSEGCNCNF